MADINGQQDMQDRLEQALSHPETIPQDELESWLRDDDFLEQYALAKDAEMALQGMHTDVDSKEAFERFKAEHAPQPKHNYMHIVWGAVVAIAACLLCLWLFRPTNAPQQKTTIQHLAKGQIYAAQPSANDVTITTGDKTTAIAGGKGNNNVAGVTVTAQGDIICQHVTQDEAGNMTSTITVPHGKVVRILLPDGTRVWLNTQSSITYPQCFPAEGAREVSVEGEAYLEVKHDARHPFVVTAGNVKTTVLGTTFNVRNYSGEPAQVTLVSGRVKVSNGSNGIILHPGQMADGNSMKAKDVYTDDIISWKDGMFSFSEQTLQEVMLEIGRWYNLNVVFANRAHINDQLHLSGERSWDVTEITSQIDDILGTHTTVRGNTITVK